ncbi:MAG TPA: hypothetical protein VMH00_12315 [Candidatus Limnocylindrales bacterium]|nr:hypothetical protein [Candidatus Limnocylindrales bacterium]
MRILVMKRRIAVAAIPLLGVLPLALAQSQSTQQVTDQTAQATPSAAQAAPVAPAVAPQAVAPTPAPNPNDTLALDLPSNQWFEGLRRRVTISPDGKWVIVNGSGKGDIQLISLKTGKDDLFRRMGDLNRLDNEVFCGAHGVARLGERTVEDGWFLPNYDGTDDDPKLSALPMDAVPVCSADVSEIGYFRTDAPDQAVFLQVRGRFRDYGVSGRITAMAFSPDGNYFYDLLFQPGGDSTLLRIDVNSGASRVVARHLDASPMRHGMALSPDGSKMYVPLASDGAPNNEQRNQPNADRWLKIYSLDLATGARQRVVESAGQDNVAPTISGGNLYWVRTVYHDGIALVPAAGGEAKEIVPGGELPMWSPDSKRIGYFYGGWRLADWALDLDDAVVSIDDQGNLASQPAVIVSGNNEDFSPAWSPDGKWIAFHSHRSPRAVAEYGSSDSTDDIYLRKADDVHAPELRLTDFGWEAGPAFWSPDGTKLLFSSWDRNGPPGIDKLFVLTVDPQLGRVFKSERFPLPSDVRSAACAAWSPDGKQIAIEDNRGGENRTLWAVNVDGSNAERLVDYKGTTYDGVDWTSDGKTIVYSGLIDGHMQLFVVPSFGGSPRQLTHDSENLLHPQVSPDGKWIACTRITQSKQIWRRPLN